MIIWLDGHESRIYCGTCGECIVVPLEGDMPVHIPWDDPFWDFLKKIHSIETDRCQYATTMRHK